MKRVEKKWQKKWLQERLYEPNFSRAKKPFYNLMMFPYPSAEGLHMGATRTFSGVDVYGRFKRMQGYDVFEPIGLDGFGIHSENYALKIGKHPFQHAKDSEKNFYRQLMDLGNGFAWEERVETYDPAYYRWTQWIFAQMFKNGLAYRKKAPVHWCPSCMTVLADEQVVGGHCERCDTVVIKKELEQWFLKITEYADRLLKGLEIIDWPESIKIAQRNWIGRSEGALITFSVIASDQKERSNLGENNGIATGASRPRNDNVIEIFTTRPDTLFGATFLVLGPEHPFVASLLKLKTQNSKLKNYEEVYFYVTESAKKPIEEETIEDRKKTGAELKGIKAINPANGEEIPIWVADYVLGNVGTGAIMAVPAHDQRDFEFAKKYNLPITIVICPHYPATTCPLLDSAYEGEGHLVASGKFDGMPSQEAKDVITKCVGGQKKVQYHLRDWLVSRQRYWGPPIPMIYCEPCGWQSVPEKDLPVKLPYVKYFRPTGTKKAPLATIEKFWRVRCPKCNAWARRETDVSDSFLDSSWYYIGYLMAFGNWKLEIGNSAFAKQTRQWLPVHNYIGGAEHAVLHLLYSRFVAMALHDWGFTHFEEPFARFRTNGIITKDGAKMSKSRGNVVSPDPYMKLHGADAVRMYLAFLAPFEEGGDFRDDGIKGITRFLVRVEKVINPKFFARGALPASGWGFAMGRKSQKLVKLVHQTIKKVTEDIETLHYNTAISALMVLLNAFEKEKESVGRKEIEIFLRLLAPFAPYITEELWQQTSKGAFKSIHKERWPAYDPRLIEEESLSLIVQVNGRVRDTIEIKKGITKEEAERLARDRERVRFHLRDKKIHNIIFIQDRLINFVI